MSDGLVNLPPHDRMTPDECLSLCLRSAGDYRDVIVLGHDEHGELIVRSSGMNCKDALWILMKAIDYTRGENHD